MTGNVRCDIINLRRIEKRVYFPKIWNRFQIKKTSFYEREKAEKISEKRYETDEFHPKEYHNRRKIMKQRKFYETPSVSVSDWGGSDVITSSGNTEKDYDLGKADIFDQDWGTVK